MQLNKSIARALRLGYEIRIRPVEIPLTLEGARPAVHIEAFSLQAFSLLSGLSSTVVVSSVDLLISFHSSPDFLAGFIDQAVSDLEAKEK